jgi:hypothetical protein
VPAAAVIPAPIAYIKVVAVKTLVVGSAAAEHGPPKGWLTVAPSLQSATSARALHRVRAVSGTFTLKKLECLKQAK